MSKKQTRRAAREAFPKGKAPAPVKSSGGKYSSKSARQKAKTTRTTQALRPPTWKRSIILGFIFGVLYFCVIYFWQKGGGLNFWGALLTSFIGFVVITVAMYYSDKFTYKRRLKRMQGSGK